MYVKIKKYPRMYWRVKLYSFFGFKNKASKLIKRIEAKRVTVKIDDYDMYDLDGTLAQIIAPALRKFRSEIYTSPIVEYDDVPENLRPEDPEKAKEDIQRDGTVDDLYHKRWEWVLDEMIFAFESYKNENTLDETGKVLTNEERVQNGLRLFGKYYQALWD
jgi:hypothetical protein